MIANRQAELMQRALRVIAQLPEGSAYMFTVTDRDGSDEPDPTFACLNVTTENPILVVRELGGDWERSGQAPGELSWTRLDGSLEITVEAA